MTRAALIPPADTTLHVIGDTHFDVAPTRTSKMQTDLALTRMAKPAARIQIGDQTNDSLAAQDTAALAFLAAVDCDAVACGNHDLFNSRTIAQWETTYAAFKAAQNYTVDIGFALLVFIGVTSGLSQPFTLTQTTLDWLDTTLANADKDCWICCHYPLYNTARELTFYGTGDANWAEDQWRTDTEDVGAMCMYPDLTIAKILNSRPNAKMWISGHTHSDIDSDGLITVRNVGQWTEALLLADGGYTNMLSARQSDFEQATITGWSHTQTGTATVNAWEVSTTWANRGTRSLHYSVTANANSTAAQAQITTITGIVAGDVYVITAKVNVVQMGAKGPSFSIGWQDSAGTSLSNVRSSSITETGVHDITIVCRAPASAAKVLVSFGNDSFNSMQLANGETLEVYLDDVWVVQTDDSPAGSRDIIAVNTSAPWDTGTVAGNRANNKICTVYLTKNETTIDVRARNHGSGNWHPIQGERVVTVDIPA